MTFVLRTATDTGNPNLPDTRSNPVRDAIMAARPFIWLHPDSQQIGEALDGTLALLGDFTSRTWRPTRGKRPEVIDAGTTKAIRFAVGTDGSEALTNVGNADLLPASPSGLTLVALIRCPVDMAVDRSVIVGTMDETPLAFFVNTDGKLFFMSKYNDGASVMSGNTNLRDGLWHTVMVAVPGTGAGGQIFVDGVADNINSGNTFSWNANRKLMVGSAGLTGVGRYFEGDFGGLLGVATDVRLSANSELSLAVNAEFEDEQLKRAGA